MNRRAFLQNSSLALFGFTILPGADRIWKSRSPSLGFTLWTPKYFTATWECDPRFSLRFERVHREEGDLYRIVQPTP